MALPFFPYRKERITLICMHRMSWKGSYAENKIITEEDKELQSSWIVLTKIVYKINQMLLDVLAMDIPDKM